MFCFPLYFVRMKTKIVITLGPSCDSPAVLGEMFDIGFDVARVNFSHSTFEWFRKQKKIMTVLAKKKDKRIEIMQDLQGPRIRVHNIPKGGMALAENMRLVLSTRRDHKRGVIEIDDPTLHEDIKKGHPIYLVNGAIELETTGVRGTEIRARVVRGGMLYPNKGVNVPHTVRMVSGLTAKDRADLEFGLAEGVDWVAVSFVQSAKDIEAVRNITGKNARIIAKIETAFAIKNIEEIIRASDGIMIARGDLGIEVPNERIPYLQNDLIRRAKRHKKPSIMATQMLASMTGHSRPTMAEVSDVGNAVLNRADMIMLSDETASGRYPVLALETMSRIARETEKHIRRSR